MRIIKHITSRLGRYGFAALAVLVPASLVSCDNDDELSAPYVRFNNEVLNLEVSSAGGSEHYEMYSNLKHWELVVEYFTDDETWVDVFENRGSGDGRFDITVFENTSDAFIREANVHVVSGGQSYATIKVKQAAVNPFIELDMSGLDYIQVSNRGATRTIKLNTNTLWEIETGGVSWISEGESTANSVDLVIEPSNQDGIRETTVRFVMIGTGNESVNTELKVSQRGQDMDVDRAELVTIANLLSSTAPGSMISGNYKIEGHVITDISKGNIEDAVMIVQDESGKGIAVEFIDPSENVIPMNNRVVLHVPGYTLVTTEMGGTSIIGATAEELVVSSASSSGATPVEITDLSLLNSYENVLVTLKDVEFSMPYGTYHNVEETNLHAHLTNDNSEYSIADSDTPYYYAHILRGRDGNTAKLYTYYKYLDKYITLVPQGTGNITGVAMKYTKFGQTFTSVRLRNNRDVNMSTSLSDRLTGVVARFGPWNTTETYNSGVPATEGNGTILCSQSSTITTTTGNSQTMYWGWNYIRTAPSEVDENFLGSPAWANNLSVQGTILNVQQWWNKTGSTITDWAGEAYIATFSTSGVTGDLYLTIATSSSTSGPRNMIVEWSTDENTPVNSWNRIDTYISPDANNNFQQCQYTFPLPAAMKNQTKVVMRLRAADNVRATNNGSTIGASGTVRLAYFCVAELK